MPPNTEAIIDANGSTEKGITFSSSTKAGGALSRSLTKTYTDTPDEDLNSLLRKTMRMSTLLDKTNKPEKIFSYHEYNDEVRREKLYKQAIGSENFFTLDSSNRTSKLISDFTLAIINEKPIAPRDDTHLELGNANVEVRTVKWYKSKLFLYGILVAVISLIIIIVVVLA
ncbi:hypothetical protein K7432_008844 [Basidiobolus ranarum]|uniref:Uncharacterized protein n=1 Tax=Basidiobolus ranarum TaxID=34480 RepID=A0ABR2WRD5_9FUNG